MIDVHRAFSILALTCLASCALDFEYGASESDEFLPLPGGSIEFLAFEAQLQSLEHSAEGPDGPVDEVVDGPWSIEVISRSSTPPVPPWVLTAGDWNDLRLAATVSTPPAPASLDASFLADDGSATPVHIEFTEAITLELDRPGLTRLDESLSFTVVERLDPPRWFPNINLTNVELEADGSILLSPNSNTVVYDQVMTALEQSARDWLDP